MNNRSAKATTPSPSMAATSRSQRWCRELYIMSFISFLPLRRRRRPHPRAPAFGGGSICFGIGYDYSRFPDKPQEETRDKMDELPGNIFLFSAKTYKAYRRHRYSRSRARRRVRETVERFSPSSPAIWGMVIPRS